MDVAGPPAIVCNKTPGPLSLPGAQAAFMTQLPACDGGDRAFFVASAANSAAMLVLADVDAEGRDFVFLAQSILQRRRVAAGRQREDNAALADLRTALSREAAFSRTGAGC
jgi:hypothetical protein